MRRDNLFHMINSDTHKIYISTYGNKRNVYTVIISGNGKQGYRIKFDDLPAGNQEMYDHWRNIVTVVTFVEEEVYCDHSNTDLNVMKPLIAKDVEVQAKCMNIFFEKKDEDIITAKRIKMNYNKEYEDQEKHYPYS